MGWDEVTTCYWGDRNAVNAGRSRPFQHKTARVNYPLSADTPRIYAPAKLIDSAMSELILQGQIARGAGVAIFITSFHPRWRALDSSERRRHCSPRRN